MMTNAPRWFGLGLLLLSITGCAATWDEITSKERDYRYIFNWNKPSPLQVIQRTDDGARRADALGALKEPLRNRGNAEDQAAYLNILGTAAKTDHEPLCRLAAIRTLGRFKDPQAARILEEVVQQQNVPDKNQSRQAIRFNADINAMIRKEALVALGNTGDPEAIHLLLNVARSPGPSLVSDTVDRHQTQDEKIVAICALGKFKTQESVDALKSILQTRRDANGAVQTEKDIALRIRAAKSLEEITGKRWPVEMEAWQSGDAQPLPPETIIEKATYLVPKLGS